MDDSQFMLRHRPSQAFTGSYDRYDTEGTEPKPSSTMVAASMSGRREDVVGSKSQQRTSGSSIQIRPGEAGRVIVVVPYTRERVEKIKTMAGRRWNPDEKYWTVPHSKGAINHLVTLFAGEPIDVDPSLASGEGSFDQGTSYDAEIRSATGQEANMVYRG